MVSKFDTLEKQNLSWSLNETRDALSNSLFLNIPNEIMLHLFGYLSVKDLCHVSLVCRSFKMIADQDELWKPKCNTSMKPHSKSYKEIYMEWIYKKSIRNKKLMEFDRQYIGRTACIICPPPKYPGRPANQSRFQSIGGFDCHPNSTQAMAIKLSVDIDKTTRQLIALLEKAFVFEQQWKQSVVLKQMIQRYYRFMQLKASLSPNTLLIPTFDIEIIWQTHLLRPEMYRNDCMRLFGRMIDHSLIIKNEVEQYFQEQAFIDTCQLYEQRFGDRYCPLPTVKKENQVSSDDWYDKDELTVYSYWDETYFEFSSNLPNDYENPFSFTEGDIILDLKWYKQCKKFMSKAIDKVSSQIPYFYKRSTVDLSSGALKRLKKSYERFLYMAAKYPLKDGNGFIPPTYAIDIIWHSHMQEPINYESDCLRLVGYVIYHDPCPIVDDEKMQNSCDQVDQIWRNEFQCEIETDHLYNTSDNQDMWFG